MRLTWLAPVVLAALLSTACAPSAGSERDVADQLPSPGSELASAPAELSIDGARLRIEAEAWRHVPTDTPGSGTRCTRLCAELRLVPDDASVLRGLGIVAVHVVRGDTTAAFETFEVEESDRGVTVTAERGPETESGTVIELVLEVNLPSGERRHLRAYGVVVG